jgi:hypothetical protein
MTKRNFDIEFGGKTVAAIQTLPPGSRWGKAGEGEMLWVTADYRDEIETYGDGLARLRRLNPVYSYLLVRRDEEAQNVRDAETSVRLNHHIGQRSALDTELQMMEAVGQKYATDLDPEQFELGGVEYEVRTALGVVPAVYACHEEGIDGRARVGNVNVEGDDFIALALVARMQKGDVIVFARRVEAEATENK